MIPFLIGAASAFAGALGFGSGCVLLLCLSLRGVEPLVASGINLLFFPLTGGLSLVLHSRRGLVQWSLARPLLLFGLLGALGGSLAAGLLPRVWLSRLFGLLLLVLAAAEFASCLKKREK